MVLEKLLEQIINSPQSVDFTDVMEAINVSYHYTPTQFTNGFAEDKVVNEAGTNEGSCRVFAFGLDQQLNEQQTLACFGTFYRDDVLGNLDGEDHANIRAFIKHGWAGISFNGQVLTRIS